jgi:hypothetical protein
MKRERWPADKGMRLDHVLLSKMSERLGTAAETDGCVAEKKPVTTLPHLHCSIFLY